MPPVHSGMVPAALPARSPPSGVRSWPRRAACSAVMAAKANEPAPERARRIERRVFMARKRRARLERVFQGGREVIAVGEEIVAAGAEVIDVAHLESPGVLE